MNAAKTAQYAALLKAVLPVMDAFAKGEEIEFRRIDMCRVGGVPSPWIDCKDPLWIVSDYEYRIKPKPKHLIMIEVTGPSGNISWDPRPAWTKQECEDACKKWNWSDEHRGWKYRVVEFVEKQP